jgi:hypothetical protein
MRVMLAANKANGFPVHKSNTEFSPRRLFLWVVQIMQRYTDETERHLSSHDFRRAASLGGRGRIHPKKAADAFGVTVAVMLRYYTVEQKAASERMTDTLAGVLDPTARMKPAAKPNRKSVGKRGARKAKK